MKISPEAQFLIDTNKSLKPFLAWLEAQVNIRFPENHELSIEVFHDQESEYWFLCGYIRLEKYDSTTMSRIKEIRRMYHITNLPTRFLLSTDFKTYRGN